MEPCGVTAAVAAIPASRNTINGKSVLGIIYGNRREEKTGPGQFVMKMSGAGMAE